MIRPIDSNSEIRDFLKKYYNEPVPDDFEGITAVSFVLGKYDPDLKGCFPVSTINNELLIHACFKPAYRGKYALKAARQAFDWLFSNTNFSTIKATISDKHIQHFAVACGMTRVNQHHEIRKWADS